MISLEHYIEVLERISDVVSVGERVRFGELAVGLGYAKPDDVGACLAEQVRGLVLRVFQTAEPTWSERALPADRDLGSDIPMHVEAIFLDAVRWLDDSRKAALGLGNAHARALQPAWDLAEIDLRFELTPDEVEFVRLALAGDKTVGELCSAKVPDAVDPHSILTALIATGAAISRDRGRATIHGVATTTQRRPSRPLPTWTQVDEASAKRAVVRVAEARATAPAMKAVGTLLAQTLDAERSFQRGRQLFRAGEVRRALDEFERALASDPASQEYALFAQWSRHQLGGNELDAALATDLGLRAQGSLRQNPRCAFGHFVLGEVLRHSGKTQEARAQLARALRLDPELFDSLRERRVGRLRPSHPDGTSEERPSSSRKVAASTGPLPAADSPERSASNDLRLPQPPAAAAPAEPAIDAPTAMSHADVDPTARRADPISSGPAKDERAGDRTEAASASARGVVPAPTMGRGSSRPRVRALSLALVVVGSGAAIFVAAMALRSARSSYPSRVDSHGEAPRSRSGEASRLQPGAAPTSRPAPITATSTTSTTGARAPEAGADAAVNGAAAVDTATRVATGVADASAPPSDAGRGSRDDAGAAGVILLPKTASGHRVFVDGRLAYPTGGRVDVACGRREVRIGSQGPPRWLDVPCGGEIELP